MNFLIRSVAICSGARLVFIQDFGREGGEGRREVGGLCAFDAAPPFLGLIYRGIISYKL